MTKNILFCYYTPGGTSYYYDFAEDLLKSGNRVMHWNFHYEKFEGKNMQYILEKLNGFKPDLIFSYNNICPEDVLKKFSIPTLILDADNPEFFHNKNIINKYEFLYYLGYQSCSKDLYKRVLGAKITDDNYLYFPTATNFQSNRKTPSDINISFIGSNFYRDFLENRVSNDSNRDTILRLSTQVSKNYYHIDNDVEEELLNFSKYYFAGQDRLKSLSALSDLGLEIFSNSDWRDLFKYDLELANCFNQQSVVTKEENQNIYNRSKIAVNLSHPQATDSFSWRVPDIMASNACLVMEYKKDWQELFGVHISDKVKDTIIYKDRYDMRNKSIKLLEDEELRLLCVKECQNAVEKNGRWRSRISDLEKFLNIKLLNLNDENSSGDEARTLANELNVKFLETEVVISEKLKHQKSKNYINKKNKTRLSIIFKSVMLLIYFIPILGKIFIKKKKAYKMIKQISDSIAIL